MRLGAVKINTGWGLFNSPAKKIRQSKRGRGGGAERQNSAFGFRSSFGASWHLIHQLRLIINKLLRWV